MSAYPNTIRVYQDKDGGWRWQMTARNGLIVADSGQKYGTRANAERAAKAVATREIVVARIDFGATT